MKTVNLYVFVSKEEGRPAIQRPWSENGFTFATNGKLLIRVSDKDYPALPNPEAPKVGSRFAWNHASLDEAFWRDLPEIPPRKFADCKECGMDDCDPNDRCPVIERVTINGVGLNNHLLADLVRFDKVQVHIPDNIDPEKIAPIPVRFEGGLGYIMPLKPQIVKKSLDECVEICAGAISHMLLRIQNESKLQELCGAATDVFGRLTAAKAAVEGRDVDTVRDEIIPGSSAFHRR